MGEHAGDEELSEAMCTFGALAESTILHGSAFMTAQTALLVDPSVIESDVRDELSALVADAPGGVNTMMKTILALSRINGGVGLRGCNSASMLAERLNELRTQIVDYSLKRSLRGAVSPVRVSPVGESNASLPGDGSIQVKVTVENDSMGPTRKDDAAMLSLLKKGGIVDAVGHREFFETARCLELYGKSESSSAIKALADKLMDGRPDRFFEKFDLKAAIKLFTLGIGHTEESVVAQFKKMTGETDLNRDLMERIAAYSSVLYNELGIEAAGALAAAPSELSAMLDGTVPRLTQNRDFDSIVLKVHARALLDRARAARAAVAFDIPPEGLSHAAIKYLKTVYIPAATAGFTQQLFELRQVVDDLRRKGQGGGGGGGGGGDKKASGLVCRHWNGTEGSCTYKNCKYLHPGGASDKKSSNLCRDFQKGRCTRGADCMYAHVLKSKPGTSASETAAGGEPENP
jgi:hypothetical protein